MNKIGDAFWAKFKKDEDGELTWHPLLCHSADVAIVFETLIIKTKLGKRLAQLAGWPNLDEIHICRLAALAALHDAGKVNHGFQNKILPQKYPVNGHVGQIIDVLNADANYQEKILLPLNIQECLMWFESEETAVNFLCAAWAHHGKPVPPQYSFRADIWKANADRDPIEGLKKLGDAIKDWFPLAFHQDDSTKVFPKNGKFTHVFNGLLTLADWLGSDERFFQYSEYEEDYVQEARDIAEHVVDEQFLDITKSREILVEKGVSYSHFCDFRPFKIQENCLELPVYKNGSLTILESDTGSGKTEATIARYLRLCEQNVVDGMYFAVPTRSAATQLYERVREAIAKVFPDVDTRPPVIQAVSGYIKADGVEANALPGFKVLWPDEDKHKWLERGWAAEQPKRYLAGAIVVGTIDQVLMGALKVKHAHMRIAALLRQFLVVDEVHSSDQYMTDLLKKVLDIHLQAGGHAMLMSATLGTATRLTFTSPGKVDLPPLENTLKQPYPLLTHTNGNRETLLHIEGKSSGKQKHVEMITNPIANSPDKVARLARKFASKGGRVLVIRNLVSDCIKVQTELENQIGSDSKFLFRVDNKPTPHHSRYSADDRKLMDKAIEANFDKKSKTNSLIACATQTVEQSLDIDADLLITDLCPIDVLLQRIGRLHRHNRERLPEFKTAKCIVLVPENRDLSIYISNGEAKRGKHGIGTVYDDLRVIEATWRVLEDKNMRYWKIPEHNRMLVEKTTHPHVLSGIVKEFGSKWILHQEYLDGRFFAENMQAKNVTIDFEEPFMECRFPDDSSLLKTRLGQSGYRIYFRSKPLGPFSNRISEVTLPAWMLQDPPDDFEVSESEIMQLDEGFSFKFSGQNFLYNRFGITSTSK